MLVLHDKATLLHETVELLGSKLIPAIESPQRIEAIVEPVKACSNHEVVDIKTTPEDEKVTIELARATHKSDYLEHIQHVFDQWRKHELVEEDGSVLPECFRLHNVARTTLAPPKDTFARAGYYAFDMSTGISKNSWQSTISSANLAVQAAHVLLGSPYSKAAKAMEARPTGPYISSPKSVLALCRPPGHHCTGSQAGGYCYINNIAVAVTTLRHFSTKKRVRRTSNPHFSATSTLKFAILDLDFHHGNGTQEQFWTDPNVFYVSIHGEDEFPYYTGAADERGPKNNLAYDTTLNLPLKTGAAFEAYLEKLHIALNAIQNFKADYLLVSLGFDTFHLDPLGKFQIHTEDYKTMAQTVRAALKELPAMIVLEGGYVVDRLGENLLSFLRGWEEAEGQVFGFDRYFAGTE